MSKEYIPLTIKDNLFVKSDASILEVDDTNEIGKVVFDELCKSDTTYFLIDCAKEVHEYLFDESDEGCKIDFILASGLVSFYCDKDAYLELMKFQNEWLKGYKHEVTRLQFVNASEYTDPDAKKAAVYRVSKAIAKYEKELQDKVLSMKDSFIRKAYINMSYLNDYSGSIYGECHGYDDIGKTININGLIDLDEFKTRLGQLGYVEGVNAGVDESICNPAEFLVYALKNNIGNTNFAFNVPFTSKAKKANKMSSL